MNRNFYGAMANGVRQIFSKHSTTHRSGQTYHFEYSKHPQREICFVLAGTSSYMLNNNIYVSEPGTVFLVDAWEPHAHCYAENDDNLLHLWFHFTDKGLRLVLLRVSNGECFRKIEPLFLPIAFATLLIHRWDMLDALPIVTPALEMEYMAPPINLVIGELNIFLREHENQMPSKWKLLSDAIAAVKDYILARNGRDCSYERLEQISGYNRYYLARNFNVQVGCTIGQFIEKARINYVRQAMLQGLQQKEIAYELGFSATSNYCAWKRKYMPDILMEDIATANPPKTGEK